MIKEGIETSKTIAVTFAVFSTFFSRLLSKLQWKSKNKISSLMHRFFQNVFEKREYTQVKGAGYVVEKLFLDGKKKYTKNKHHSKTMFA